MHPGFREFAQALRAKNITLMACESAPTLKDVKEIIAEKFYQIINVKLCRSGGFRRALGMIDAIRKSPLSFQIGCTPRGIRDPFRSRQNPLFAFKRRR